MNSRLLTLLFLSVATSARAGDPPPSDSKLADIVTAPSTPSRWRIGAGYAQLLGLKTEFTGLGNFRSAATAQPLGSGIDRDYDDGFVHLDSSGNLGGETWNWSYANATQYNSSGAGSMDFSITNSLSNGHAEEDGGAKPGAEVFAYYDMGGAGFSVVKDRQASWGFRAGLQYSRIDVSNNDILSTGLTKTTDTFDLNGTIPPLSPYTGSFGGPGPLLGDSPSRSTGVGGTGLVKGSRELDVHLALTNLGSYLEVPITEKFDVLLEAGVSFGVASGSYKFNSDTTASGLGSQQSSGRESRTRFLPGLYLGLGATYQINKDWAILGSGRYQNMESLDLGANGTEASLSFDSAFVVSLGVLYSF